VEVLQGDLSEGALDALRNAKLVAWDIETSGLDWRNDRIGTCQLHAGSGVSVIVQTNREVPERLRTLLSSPDVVKVFHHAPFDLRFMTTQWKTHAASVACTKVASKLLFPAAPAEEHSLKALLATHLGVVIEKGDVRTSDWTARDLTEEQLRYAASDVADLLQLYGVLTERLTRYGLMPLYESCLSFLPSRVELDVGGWPDVFAY
jgi:ribonuclease D